MDFGPVLQACKSQYLCTNEQPHEIMVLFVNSFFKRACAAIQWG